MQFCVSACAGHMHLHTGVHICASVGASMSRRAHLCVCVLSWVQGRMLVYGDATCPGALGHRVGAGHRTPTVRPCRSTSPCPSCASCTHKRSLWGSLGVLHEPGLFSTICAVLHGPSSHCRHRLASLRLALPLVSPNLTSCPFISLVCSMVLFICIVVLQVVRL